MVQWQWSRSQARIRLLCASSLARFDCRLLCEEACAAGSLRSALELLNIESSYHALCAYTLTQPREEFIHQHVVDAQAVQTALATTKPITVIFGLVGLCLLVEQGWTGLEVQQAHLNLARQRRDWPRLPLPSERGELTATEVLAQPEGPARREAIHAWCACVWRAFADVQPTIRELLRAHRVLP